MFDFTIPKVGSIGNHNSKKKDLAPPEPAVTQACSSAYELHRMPTNGTAAAESIYLQEVVEEDLVGGTGEGEDNAALYPKMNFEVYSVLLGSFLICFTLFGLMNSIGAIESRVQEHELSTAKVSSVSWIFSIFMFMALFMGIVVGPLYDSFGAMPLQLLGTLLIFGGLMGTASSETVGDFIGWFSFMVGIGAGFVVIPSVAAVTSWIAPARRAFYVGVIQGGGSIGGIVFPIMLRATYHLSFMWAIRILAFVTLAIDLAGTFLCRDRRKELQRLAGTVDERTFWQKLRQSVDLRAFKEKEYCALNAAIFFNEFALLIILTFLSSYAMMHGFTQAESYNLIIVLNALGLLGTFIPPYMANTYGSYNVMLLMSALVSLFSWAIWLPLGKYKPAMYVFVVLFGFCHAATYALTPANISTEMMFVNSHREGTKRISFSTRYGTSYGACVSFGNIIALPLAGTFLKHKTVEEYNHLVIFAAACSTAGTACLLLARWTLVGWHRTRI